MRQICVCTVLIGNLSYKEKALENHKKYCAHHQYDYVCLEESKTEFHPMWEKPDLILAALNKGYDFVFYTDADSFFMNMDRGLEDFIVHNRDLVASGDHNDLINTGHLFFKNSEWSRWFINQWIKFRRPLTTKTMAKFSAVTTHFVYQNRMAMFNDQPPVNILLAGGDPKKESAWFDLFNKVNFYSGNPCRVHTSAPDNIAVSQSLIAPTIAPHVKLLSQREMNAYPDTFKRGDFIVHFVTHKNEIDRILAELSAPPPADPESVLPYAPDSYVFSNNWFENQKKHIQRLVPVPEPNEPFHMVEIGAFEGAGTTFFIDNYMENKDSTITVIDPFSNDDPTCTLDEYTYNRFVHNVKASKYPSKVTFIKDYSRVALSYLAAKKMQYDFISVDGSHLTSNVLFDAVVGFHLLKEGAIMMFDDYPQKSTELESSQQGRSKRFRLPNGPKDAIDSFIHCNIREIELLHKDYQVFIRKVKRKN